METQRRIRRIFVALLVIVAALIILVLWQISVSASVPQPVEATPQARITPADPYAPNTYNWRQRQSQRRYSPRSSGWRQRQGEQ